MIRESTTESLSTVILESLDNAWHPLLERLADISDDEYDSYSSRLFCATGTGLGGRNWVRTAEEAQSMLAAAWKVFRSGVVGWGDDELWSLLGQTWGPFANHTNLDLALYAQREVIHHGAEIALLRDLYAARGRST